MKDYMHANWTNMIKDVDFIKLLYAVLFKKRYPLSITWALTKRCNCHCKYCLGNVNEEELNTEQILNVIEQTYSAGVRFISFTGGEPLLRKDIKDIVNYAYKKGMFVKLNTNGLILREKIDDIKNVDLVHLSLDAQEYINDRIRGKGSFRCALEGIKIVKKRGIKIAINTVISDLNVCYLNEIIDISKKYNVSISFQPATLNIFGKNEPNSIAPKNSKYRTAIKKIIQLKKSKTMRRLIINSITGLKHLSNWPNPVSIPCYAGILSFRIDHQGKLYNCDEYKEKGIDILQYGFKRSVEILSRFSCKECWSSSRVEFNLIMSLHLGSLINAIFNSINE